MPTRSNEKIKKLIYDTLKNDATLEGLLKGVNKVIHENPLNLKEYPCVVYTLMEEEDEPFNEDLFIGISRSTFEIQIFSNSPSSREADGIENRIYELLHGQTLVSTDIRVFSVNRTSRSSLFEIDQNIHRVITNYAVVNVLK